MLPEISKLENHLITLPSQKTVKVRKWKMKDKKEFLLLVDKNSPKPELRNAIFSILKSCIVDNTDLNLLSKIDITYLFIELRKLSEGDVIEVSFKCPSCGKDNENIKFNLSECLEFTPANPLTVNLSNNITIAFKEIPYVKQIEIENNYSQDKVEYNLHFFYNSIKSISVNGTLYDSFSIEELEKFIGDLDVIEFNNLFEEFIKSVGNIILQQKTKCKFCDKESNILLGELEDFF